MADLNALKKQLLNGKKSERVVFAVTPEMKAALEKIAMEKCTNVSSLLTDAATGLVVDNQEFLNQD